MKMAVGLADGSALLAIGVSSVIPRQNGGHCSGQYASYWNAFLFTCGFVSHSTLYTGVITFLHFNKKVQKVHFKFKHPDV